MSNQSKQLTLLTLLAVLALGAALHAATVSQDAADRVGHLPFLAWEAENYDSITTLTPANTHWTDLDDIDAIGGKALLAAEGSTGTNKVETANIATYKLFFTQPGRYMVYWRARESGGGIADDSFWAQYQLYQFPIYTMGGGGDYRWVNDGAQTYVTPAYRWYRPNRDGGMKVIEVTEADLQKPVDLSVGARESGFVFDRFVAIPWDVSSDVLTDQAILDTLENSTYGDPPAWNPNPANGQIQIPLNAQLSWSLGVDPENYEQPNPTIYQQDIYLSISGTDPNLVLVDTVGPEVTAINPADYGRTLDYDQTWAWRIDQWVDQNDPNLVEGSTWTFQTLAAIPVITDPADTFVDAGATATFEVAIDSIGAVTDWAWYKAGDPDVLVSDADPDVTITNTDEASILEIANADDADEGQYYFIASNAGGPSNPTAHANLAIRKLLAWYPFEDNLLDATGMGNDGSGDVNFTEGIEGQFAADPNGVQYAQLPANAYPKAGFGNGLGHFTYAAWVQVTPGAGGRLFGAFNDGGSQGLQFWVGSGTSSSASLYFRDVHGTIVNPTSPSGLGLDDGQWHYIAATYDGNVANVYVDAMPVASHQRAISEFVDWQYPLVLFARNNRGNIDEFFNGSVDDLRIYNFPMTGDEIAQEYYDVTGILPCLYGNPTYDLNGDCVVNLLDLAEFASEWLASGLFVPMQ